MWMGCGCPTACLNTQVTNRAMQWLLVASVRGQLVGFGHLGDCLWDVPASSPTCTSPNTTPCWWSSRALLPCAQCPLPSDKKLQFFKSWEEKQGKSSAACARCIPSSAGNCTLAPRPCHQPSPLEPPLEHFGPFTGTRGTGVSKGCPG